MSASKKAAKPAATPSNPKIDVGHVATLAHLSLTKAEIKKFSGELDTILAAFKTLDEVDTSKVQPAFHPVPLKNQLREDKPADSGINPFSNTKLREGNFFKGPKIQ